jgi:farnesyl diphosphate synthase
VAVNDAFYLESCVYHIMRKYCREKAYYMSIVDLFHEVSVE